MIATVLQGGCNEVSIPVNLQGNYILQTNVIKPPSLLYPWNISIQYDNVFWASFNVNTGSPDDIYNFNELPVHNINNIVVYFCDQGNYYLTSDEIVLLITISDENGNVVQEYNLDIQVDIQPLYPQPIYFFVAGKQVEFSQEINIVYAPVTYQLQIILPVGQQAIFTLLVNGTQVTQFSNIIDPCLQPICECLSYIGQTCNYPVCNCSPKCLPQGCILTGSTCLNKNCTELELYYSCPGYKLTISPYQVIVEYPNYTIVFPTICGTNSTMIVTKTITFNTPVQGTLTWKIYNVNFDTPLNCYTVTVYLIIP